MKKLFLVISILSGLEIFSQAPQFLNYQAVARDASGTIVTTAIGIKFEILQGSPSGILVYEETNTIIPSSVGVFTTGIGSGTPGFGTFSGINWANSPYFIRVSIDPTGGTSYSTVGTSQLLSVPYALYAQTAGNAQTFTAGSGITINSGTITNASPNQTVNISGPGVLGTYPNYTVTAPGTPNAGPGISIISGTITNTAPDQTVTISGAVGTYPNFTVTPTPATSITATGTSILVTGTNPNYTIVPSPSLTVTGNQLSIADGNTVILPAGTTYTNGSGIALTSGTIITNTAPDQTVTIANGTNVIVTGTYPSFTVDATPNLSIAGNTLSITGGTSVVLPSAPSPTAGPGISISSGTITNTAPDQTVTINNGTNVNVGGIYPNFTVDATPSLSIAGNTLSITGGTSVVLPSPPTPTAGPGISIVSGTISNTAPDQTVIISNGTNVNVNGTYPTFTVNSTPSLSIAGNTLSITGGTSVVLPSPPVLTPSTGISINSGTITNTAPNQTVTLTGLGSTTIGGTYPNFTIGTPVAPAPPVITGTGAASVTTVGNNYTVNVPYSTYNNNTGVFTTGTNTISVAPTLSISGNVLSSGPSSNSITIPSYSAGSGLVLSGASPNFTLGTTSTGTNTGWSTLGNAATNATVNFIGTTDNVALNFRVNNAKSGRIDPAGPTFLGFNAGANNTSIYSTGFGFNVLNANTTGSLNTAMGYAALDANTSGTDNTAMGQSALGTNVTGNFNTAIGSNAMGLNNNGVSNTAVGSTALYSNSNGSQNVAVGGSALYLNTVGTSNSAIGTQALNNNTAAGNNVAIGTYALNGQAFSNGNTPWPTDNVAVGYQALYVNNPTSTTNGYQNTALGTAAMLNNTTGYENTSVGHQSLFSNNVGTWNTSIGKGSLYNNLSGNHNFAGANYAMYDNTTGSDNVGIGYTAMRYSKTGSENTVLGFEAGFGVSGQSYSNNTLIGKSAGYSLSTGSGNVFLGHQAGYNETGSNKLYIANTSALVPLIYGNFSTNQVGIGTTSPTHVLDLFSSSTSGLLNLKTNLLNTQITMDDNGPNDVYLTTTNGVFDVWTSATQRLTVDLAGYVGIGQTAPTTKLHLSGANTTTFVNAFSASPESAIRIHNSDLTQNNFSSLIFSTLASNFSNFEAAKIVGVNSNHTSGSIGGDLVFMTRDPANINERMRIVSNGNIGIGTPAPVNKLHINGGGITITDGSQGAGKVLTSDASGNGSWQSIPFPPKIAFLAGNWPTTDQTIPGSAVTVVDVGSGGARFFNDGGGYNTGTAKFSAPVAGVYQFDAHLLVGGSGGQTYQLFFRDGGGQIQQARGTFNATEIDMDMGITVKLSAGQTVWFEIVSASTLTIKRYESTITGHLIYQ
jgi:hypothetical protein